jgi:hypothetical protein
MRHLKSLLVGLTLVVSACGGGGGGPNGPGPLVLTPGQTPPAGVHGTIVVANSDLRDSYSR